MATMRLTLLDAFSVSRDGDTVAVITPGAQRLVVLLALSSRTMSRIAVAGALSPDSPTDFAAVRLRSTVARLDAVTRGIIEVTASGMRIDPACTVDYHEAVVTAHAVLSPGPDDSLAQDRPPYDTAAVIAQLSKSLLPDLYDDWVLGEAEDWRLLRTAALESLAVRLAADAQPELAARAARAAMRGEPLRESAHAALVRVHLSNGNQSEALRAYEQYRESLAAALQLSPTALLSDLVAGLLREHRQADPAAGTARA